VTPLRWGGRTIRALLFDMDGVIADTRAAHEEAWVQWGATQGLRIPREEFIRATMGRSNPDIMRELFPSRAHDTAFLGEMALQKEEAFLAIFRSGAVPPLAGFLDIVARATRRGLAISVGSSAPRGNIEAVLAQFGVRDAFPVVVSHEDVAAAKPAPDIFLECLRRSGADGAEAVVFEDSFHGLAAARAAGCHAVALATMHTRGQLAGHAAMTVGDFAELLEQPEWREL
jgi:HAD superfamily hydrolase (TIGR01509 family)